jgi:hypothetical protein
MLNICIVCGKEFESPKVKQYCSQQCYHKGTYEKQEIGHTCIFCGKEFVSRQKRTQLCSEVCRRKHKRREKAEAKYCNVCGVPLGNVLHYQLYCSNECKAVAVKAKGMPNHKPIWKKICPVCGKEFMAIKKERIYCSKTCYGKSKATDACTSGDFVCMNCGKEFHAGTKRKFCSRKCFTDYSGITEINNFKYESNLSDATAIKRAKRYGVKHENLDPLKVYEADNWVCRICGEPIDRSLVWPNPMSASLDHIVPLSKGGNHVRANVQASHLHCNISKSNKIA